MPHTIEGMPTPLTEPLTIDEVTVRASSTEIRCVAVNAAAKLWEGGLPRDVDIDEFLLTAADIENWINRTEGLL